VKKLLLLLTITIISQSIFAQDKPDKKETKRNQKKERISAMVKQEEEGVLSYYKQSAFGLQLRTNGYGVFFELGRMKSPRFTNLYTLELTEIKHSKEEKIGGAESLFANSYVFGKINNFYQAKLGFGQQYIIGQKGNKNGVAIMAIYGAGVSLGLEKPYYIDVIDSLGSSKSINYFSNDSASFRDRSRIIGSSGFTKGFGEMKMKPGVYAKAALRFDFGRYNESLQALEIGLSADYYFNDTQILLLNEPKKLYYQGHIAYVFGRRK
jgi:hypothetical protein